MTLKCRPGDLALVIRGTFAGSIVTCIRLETDEKLDALGVKLDKLADATRRDQLDDSGLL
jgi:hypothetical protein